MQSVKQTFKNGKSVIANTLVFLFCVGVFLYMMGSPNLPDPDAFFHAKIPVLMSQKLILPSFPWAQYTTLNAHFTDHHFLYHVFLMPFVNLLNPMMGIKLATIIINAGFMTLIYHLLKKWQVRGAFLYILILLCSWPLLFRLGLCKANGFSLIILFTGIYFIFKKNIWAVFVISFFYVWSYGGFIMMPMATFLYVLAEIIHNWFAKRDTFWLELKKTNWQLLAVSLLGMAGGLVINPFFPQNFYFYQQQVIQMGVASFDATQRIGAEWSSYPIAQLIADVPVVTVVLILSLIMIIYHHEKIKKEHVFWALYFMLFYFYTVKSQRYVEYLVPFAMVFAAFNFKSLDWPRLIYQIGKFLKKPNLGRKIANNLLVLLIIFSICLGCLGVWQQTKGYLSQRGYFDQYYTISQWLKKNTAPGTIVLHSDWDELPTLFYHNDNNYYIAMFDPRFMINYDAKLYDTWVNITMSQHTDNLYEKVVNDFKAEYVFADYEHPNMRKKFEQDYHFQKIMQTQYGSLFLVK